MDEHYWPNMLRHMVNLWAFGLSGIFVLLIGYWIFDKFTPGVHFHRELVEHRNIAVAIVIGCFLLGVSIIIAAMLIG